MEGANSSHVYVRRRRGHVWMGGRWAGLEPAHALRHPRAGLAPALRQASLPVPSGVQKVLQVPARTGLTLGLQACLGAAAAAAAAAWGQHRGSSRRLGRRSSRRSGRRSSSSSSLGPAQWQVANRGWRIAGGCVDLEIVIRIQSLCTECAVPPVALPKHVVGALIHGSLSMCSNLFFATIGRTLT